MLILKNEHAKGGNNYFIGMSFNKASVPGWEIMGTGEWGIHL